MYVEFVDTHTPVLIQYIRTYIINSTMYVCVYTQQHSSCYAWYVHVHNTHAHTHTYVHPRTKVIRRTPACVRLV